VNDLIDLKRVRHLVYLSEELHFSRAAARANLSQTAFSRSIQSLEADLGVRLFDRDTRTVMLTAAGQQLIGRAHELLGCARKLVAQAIDIAGAEGGELRLGINPMAATLNTVGTNQLKTLNTLFSRYRTSALRLSLPYHDERMPPELHRADYIVSANVARTVQVCRQAVLDARRAIAWLAAQGHDRIGILGTSLGSCLALLTTAHEPLIRAEALNHISPLFADVVWRGLSTRHVREGLEGHIELDLLRALWKPISPQWYLERLRDRQTLLVYAKYDLTFPRDLSEDLVRAFREGGIPHEVAVLRCGHYSTGKTPFKYVDGWVLTRFLKRALSRSA